MCCLEKEKKIFKNLKQIKEMFINMKKTTILTKSLNEK